MPKIDSVGHAVELTPEEPRLGSNSATVTEQKPGMGKESETTLDVDVDVGSNSPSVAVQPPPSAAGARPRETRRVATDRWRSESRLEETDRFRDTVRRKCLAQGMARYEAVEEGWRAALAAFPPEGKEPEVMVLPEQPGKEESATRGESGHIQGLSNIPSDWPELPANAGLQSEVGWVQANRLYIVDDKPGGATVVDLSHALEPAPSRAALGWLETSIRAYAKYVDIVARSLATQADEQQHIRRERMAIAEIRSLLDEMHRD